MRRSAPVLLALGLGLASSAASQPRVGLVVSLHQQAEATGARRALVQVKDLLADVRWSQALDQSFPIRLSFRLEIWRSREGWIDDFQRATEWSTVIQWEPLEDQYRVTRILLSGVEEFRFTSKEELDRWVRQINLVDALPQGTGTFYYNVTLRITALSDEDMEELERFLAGQSGTPVPPQRSSIGRSVRRFLLRMAGLPWEELEVKSGRFTVRR
jgi:dsDNA-binding SOS-regulon protein